MSDVSVGADLSVRSATVTSDDGVQLAYSVYGDGPRDVTLLHSLGLDGSWFLPFAAAMGPGYRFVVPDLRGHGRSEGGPVSLRRNAADVVAVLDECGIATTAVFGISLGGMVAQAVAATQPDRVEALCLAATTYSYDDAAVAGTLTRAAQARSGYQELVAPTVARWFGPAEDVPERLAPMARRAAAQLRSGSPEVHADYLEAMTAVGNFVVPDGMPALVLGGQDDLSTSRAVIERLAASIPGARLAFVPGGHLMAFTDPDPVAHQLRAFLARVAQAPV